MNTIIIEHKTGQVSTHRMAFMTFEQVFAKAQGFITSACVVSVEVHSPERVAIINKTGHIIIPVSQG